MPQSISDSLCHCRRVQKIQPDTKYSAYLNTQRNMSKSKNILHAHKHTHLYDEFGEGFSERLQQFRYFSAVQLKAADSDSGQITHQTGHEPQPAAAPAQTAS